MADGRYPHLPPVDDVQRAVLHRRFVLERLERGARGVEPVRITQQPGLGLGLALIALAAPLALLVLALLVASVAG